MTTGSQTLRCGWCGRKFRLWQMGHCQRHADSCLKSWRRADLAAAEDHDAAATGAADAREEEPRL